MIQPALERICMRFVKQCSSGPTGAAGLSRIQVGFGRPVAGSKKRPVTIGLGSASGIVSHRENAGHYLPLTELK